MKLTGKISIIVPVYGVELYIANCIASLCNQTYDNLEIILVDDGSKDRSGVICDEWAKKDSRVKVVHITNGGQSCARNVGLQIATGDYVGFVDGDDAITANMYEKMLSIMLEKQAEIVECNFVGRKSPEPDQMDEHAIIMIDGRSALERQLDQRVNSRYPSTSLWSKLFRAEIIKDLRLPEGKIHEEYAFLCQAFLSCKKYVYCNERLYIRTLRNDSTTAEAFSMRTFDKLDVFRERNKFLQQSGEQKLLALSRAWEFDLMLHYFGQAHENGLYEKEKELQMQMNADKWEIITSPLARGKKLKYILYWFNPRLYLKLYKMKNK